MSRRVFLRLYSCILILLVWPDRGFGADVVTPLAPGTTPSITANSDSTAPILSADGNFLLFTSQAYNLVTNDNNGPLLDVFLRNLTNGATTLVSATPDGTTSGNGISIAGGISSNNQMVVFESRASNLVSNDTNNANDIFVRNPGSGTTTLISVNRFGTGSGNGGSANPAVTPDGRFVVFESTASDLVTNDTNGVSDVFLRDLQVGTTTLISVASNGVYSAAGESKRPAISADGKIIAFISKAMNLAAGNNNTTNELYVRDLNSSVTWMIDISRPGSFPGPTTRIVEAYTHVLSADGQRLAFLAHSSNTNAVPDGIYYADLLNNTNYLVATNLNTANTLGRANLAGPTMSADGQLLAFEAKLTNATQTTQQALYVWEALTGNATLIYPAGNAPLISADGSKVAFVSFDTNNPSAPNSGRRQLLVHDRGTGATELATVDLDGNPASDAEFPAASFSADGRRVAFQSLDGNLVPNDSNRAYDVFVRDLDSDTTTLVSERAAPLPSLTDFGASSIVANCVSADGRFVVFVSDASNFVTNDANGLADVFVRDLTTGSNILVSVNAAGTGTGNGMSRDSVISANGRYVAFVSAAPDLVSTDTNALDDVFLRDLQTGTTTLVSINQDHATSANGTSSRPSLSADGRLVAFQSKANDILTNDFNSQFDVFLFDMTAGSNRLVSVNSSGTRSGSGLSEAASLTADGKRVIFQSKATDLLEYGVSGSSYQFYARDLTADRTIPISRGASFIVGGTIPGLMSLSADGNWLAFVSGFGSPLYLCDLRADTNLPNVLVASNAAAPSLSADGRFVAYEQLAAAGGKRQIFVKDMPGGATTLASVNGTGTGGGNGDSRSPVISADGRYVVFKSQADDLVGNDANGWSDIFVRDLITGTTLLASLNAAGNVSANQLSSAPVLGADGRTIIFQSYASDLAEGDRNNNRDVFLIRLGAGDSDADGLPDDWEVTYFGDLTHDGSGDSDGDGHSDFAEYKAGTNPINDTSVLRVLSINALGTGETTVIWTAVAGKTYRVQYKDILTAGWTDLSVPVTINGDQGSAMDSASSFSSARFYRVVALP